MPAAATIDDMFHYVSINRIISRLQGPAHKLTSFYGLGPGGPNTDDVGGSTFGWDLFDRTRKIAPNRARAAAPGANTPQSVGNVTATCYRMFEQRPIEYERIYRKRGLGQPFGSFDLMGQQYLTRQIGNLGEQFMNAREALIMWMFKGGLELQVNGDVAAPVPLGSGGQIKIDFQHPAKNREDVEGTFAGNWQDNANGKVIDELLALNKHSAKNSRYPQQTAWCNATTAGYVLNNAQVAKLGGTANTVFADGTGRLLFSGDTNDEGKLSNIMSFVLRGYPSMTWMVYDDEIELLNGNRDAFIPDNYVLFSPAPDASWLEWKSGSEPTKKSVDGPVEDSFGLTAWQETQRNPVSISLYMLDNGLPAPYVPTAWYWAKVAS